MTQMIDVQPDMNLLDMPDMSVNFDMVTSCSCGLENADELLEYVIPYLDDWNQHRYTVHEFARKYADKGISLWLANDVEITKSGISAIHIFLEGEIKGYVLFHGQFMPSGALQ